MSALTMEMPADDTTLTLKLPDSLRITDKEFEEFCQRNPDLRIEQDSEGNVFVMPPVNPASGNKELRLGSQLQVWSDEDGTGIAFSSSTVFVLPNGAKRSPDASWMRLSRWESLSEAERNRFSHICPEFVIELRSPSDRLEPLRKKLAEYTDNGATLGFLLDPLDAKAYAYRPGRPEEVLERPDSISAEPEMPGLVLDLAKIW